MKDRLRMRGVAPLALPLLFSAVIQLSVASACEAWIENTDIPKPSEGDIVFYADVATFYQDGQSNVEEIYCVVPNDQLVFIETEESYEGKLKYEVEILDEGGRIVGGSEKDIKVTAVSADDAGDRSIVQVLESRVSVPPGKYTARISLEDLNARKKEVVSYIMGKYNRGDVEIQIDSRHFAPGEISLSDVEFARSLRRRQEGPFLKSGFEVVPNARRRYGLLLAELPVYFEVYDMREQRSEDVLLATYSIVNKQGREIFGAENPLALSGQILGSTALFNITSLSAGSYLLVLRLIDEDGEVLARSERKFDVVWSVYSWGRFEIEALGDLSYILTEEETETFRSLTPGEQEEFLKEFWLAIDPTPGTSENEALREHFRRVNYADQSFGTAGKRGTLTDRGKLYIKYGPPDDIQSHYSDYEFVQGTREIAGGADIVPTDPFSRVGLKTGSFAPGSWDQAGSTAEAHADQRGGSTVHGKAYEIWIYDGPGEPVRRLSQRVARSAGMRFVLVDERGFGEYTLVYATEKEEH
jgi:GWxTD domain-containing protein